MKLLREALIVGLVVGGCVTSAQGDSGNHADVWGPHDVVTRADVGPDGNYNIYQPVDLTQGDHPLAVYCVGAGGSPDYSSELFDSLASHGVVVIVGKGEHQSQNNAEEAILGIDWLIEQNDVEDSEYHGHLDVSKVVAIGMSEGGNAALWTAINDPNVKSVISMAPGVARRWGVHAPTEEVRVPVLYISGTLDTVVRPYKVLRKYRNNVNSDAWYASRRGAGHLQIPLDEAVDYYIRAWVHAQLFDDDVARGEFYGDSWGLQADPRFTGQRNNLE